MPTHWFYTILGIIIPLFHLMGAAFAVHATLYTRTSQGAIAWAMSLVFFPYIAVPCYLVFGRQKFHGYVEARRAGDRRIDKIAESVCGAAALQRVEMDGARERIAVLEELTLIPFTGGNSARLLIDGDATFAAIFAAIEKAKRYILVQFFIIRDDALGCELQRRLIERAQAGVKIFMLYDEIGSIAVKKKYWAKLKASGVQVRPFNTRRGWANRFQINFRNHRKIVSVDGQIGFVGGHNVGVEYIGKSPRFGHWRDTHVALSGPALAGVELSFVEDWNWAAGEALDLLALACPGHNTGGTVQAIVIPTSPADEMSTCTFMFLAAISAARHRLWITSPYFVPDETVYDALQLAAIRGVDVRILLPDKPDHLLVYLAAFSYLDSAEKAGVKFFRYHAGFLHQKVMLIDDDIAAVGTANLDNRSMRLNFEMTLFFADPAFAADVAAMLEQDFAQSKRVDPQDLYQRGLTFRFAVRLARLLSPVQ